MCDTPESPGGLGASYTPGSRDVRLQERAMRERWPMSEAVRAKLLERMAGLVEPGSKPRVAIAAARTLIAADKLNLEQERLDRREGGPADLPAARDVLAEAEAADAEHDDRQPEGPGGPPAPEVPDRPGSL